MDQILGLGATLASVPDPTISTIIPVHNGARFVAEAISSVLRQSHQVLECIVIDDGSTDATPEAVAKFGDQVTYIRQNQAGVSDARNHGTSIARGELVAFLDHDDVWLPDKLGKQVSALSKNDARMVLCAVWLVDAELSRIGIRGVQSPGELLTGLLTFDRTELVSCGSTGLVNRQTLVDVGGFDPRLSMSADWDLVVRMLLGPGIAYVEEPLSLYRLHDSNMSHQIEVLERDMTYAFAKVFEDPRLPKSVRRERRSAYARLYRMLAGSYRDAGRYARAVLMFVKGLVRYPPLVIEVIPRARAIGRRVRRPRTETQAPAVRRHEARREAISVARRVARHRLKNTYFQALAIARVDALLTRIRARPGTTLILNLHRVSPDQNAYWPPMTPEAFALLIEYLTSTCRIIGLRDTAKSQSMSRPRVVLSFDDGCRDFVEYAVPILDRYRVRANQNVIVESVTNGEPPWIIRLVDALAAATVSRVRALVIPGFDVRLEGDDELSKTRYGTLLTGYLKWLPVGRREQLTADINTLLKETSPDDWTPMMSRHDIEEMAEFHDIGGHSYSHEAMENLGDEAFVADIDRCEAFFTELGIPMSIFAFPYGSFRAGQIEMLQARGVEDVLLVGERPSTNDARGVHSRLTIYGDTAAELRLRALGYRTSLRTRRPIAA